MNFMWNALAINQHMNIIVYYNNCYYGIIIEQYHNTNLRYYSKYCDVTLLCVYFSEKS
mgnify:CR=1 FL=1